MSLANLSTVPVLWHTVFASQGDTLAIWIVVYPALPCLGTSYKAQPQLDMGAYAWNLSTRNSEAGRSQSEASLGYMVRLSENAKG